jgi:hypothetical protein
MKRTAWNSILVTVLLSGVLAARTAPTGYRFPNEEDYSGDWKEFRDQLPTPFVVREDFNGDGVADEVWLLPASDGFGWALFAFLGSAKGPSTVISLVRNREANVQGFGVSVVEPGPYKTACGKGYWQCEPGEPDVLELQLPAFQFFKYESASSIFWWDRKSAQFRRTWISD